MLVGGPIGAFIGSIVGGVVVGVVASQLAAALSDWLTRKIFDLPKSVALENAYNFLGLHRSATNSDINSRYRKLALQWHSDKNEKDKNSKNWHKL